MNNMKEFYEQKTIQERVEKRQRYKHLNQFSKKNQIVFAGSSLTEHFPINELIQNTELKCLIYNRGIGGDTTTHLLESMNECIFDLQPSKLFINIGTNDIGLPSYSLEVLMNNYQKILNQVQEKLPDTKIYLLSYYPVNPNISCHLSDGDKAFLFNTRTNEAIKLANHSLVDLAKTYHATYIDVTSVLYDTSGQLDSKYTIEGIHLWPNAYHEILKVLENYIAE